MSEPEPVDGLLHCAAIYLITKPEEAAAPLAAIVNTGIGGFTEAVMRAGVIITERMSPQDRDERGVPQLHRYILPVDTGDPAAAGFVYDLDTALQEFIAGVALDDLERTAAPLEDIRDDQAAQLGFLTRLVTIMGRVSATAAYDEGTL
ncbi:hypothetical protein PL81_16910 [Streptomyces sp. RSD-27]|nr:hypothetical protein PL81_16910 [Streptomyces sp. RSD-27]